MLLAAEPLGGFATITRTYVPGLAEDDAVRLSVVLPSPGAGMLVFESEVVNPEVPPAAISVIAELNEPL